MPLPRKNPDADDETYTKCCKEYKEGGMFKGNKDDWKLINGKMTTAVTKDINLLSQTANINIVAKKLVEAKKFFPKFQSQLMKIAKTGIIKKKNASRNVSRITKKIAAI